MQVKEMHIFRGVSSFIMKAGAFPIPSPIMKADASPFITKVSVFPISYIERRVLEYRISILYPP
jgi:hypothetical protein